MIVSSFIIQANVITTVNYDRKTFIVQATGAYLFFLTMRALTLSPHSLSHAPTPALALNPQMNVGRINFCNWPPNSLDYIR